MRQKYVISRDGAKNKLKIREYAIIDKNLKKVASSMLQKGSFSFLCEETYENEIIVSSNSADPKSVSHRTICRQNRRVSRGVI